MPHFSHQFDRIIFSTWTELTPHFEVTHNENFELLIVLQALNKN